MLKKKNLRRMVLVCAALTLAIGAVRIAQSNNTNGRNESLVYVSTDRSGGTPEVVNGRGEKAVVFVRWYDSVSTTNARGEILETGEYDLISDFPVPFWLLY